ncbi:MAG: electron transport complex subunit RsxG [Rhodocyclaceae bacterium]|nr:electron transport complex subunit RsxG [Rhodocyclaceae bacterium]
MTLERLRPTIPYQAAALAVTVMLASAALSFAERHTRGPIEQAIAEDTRRSLGEVLPQGSYDNDPGSDRLDARDGNVPVVVHIARKAGVPTAVVLETAAKGYSGEIGLVVGIDREGRVTGVRITRHTETPGLGDKVEVAKSEWVHDFAGRDLSNPAPAKWAVKKDGGVFDQFAGATITPRAVVGAVKRSLELYRREHEAWFARRDAP